MGNRDGEHALEFISDLGSRLVDRPQITTDGLASCVGAIDEIFGADVDFAQLVKVYRETPDQKGPEKKYSPGVCTGTFTKVITSKPDPSRISTSHVESHNQKIRAICDASHA